IPGPRIPIPAGKVDIRNKLEMRVQIVILVQAERIQLLRSRNLVRTYRRTLSGQPCAIVTRRSGCILSSGNRHGSKRDRDGKSANPPTTKLSHRHPPSNLVVILHAYNLSLVDNFRMRKGGNANSNLFYLNTRTRSSSGRNDFSPGARVGLPTGIWAISFQLPGRFQVFATASSISGL